MENPRFPHLPNTPFPGLSSVNPYQVPNSFDYGEWRDNARIKVTSVPWDSGYRNVVEWHNDAERDDWLNSRDAYRVDEPTRVMVSPDGFVRVPVPFNVASQANYLVIDYPDMPVPGGSSARHRFCYFITASSEVAPSTTELAVELDVWTTFINSLSVSGLMLERGHAPMAAVTANEYLADPVRNCRYLMAPDVTYGSIEVMTSRTSHVVNREVYAIVFMAGAPTEDWGSYATDDINVPVQPITYHNGVPSLPSFAMEPEKLMDFLTRMRSAAPQAFQTVGCVAFVPKSLAGYTGTIEVFGVEVYALWSRGWVENDLVDLAKPLFKYDSRYADMAKLYTYPYAELRMRDHEGNTVPVRIEDTTGTLSVFACIALTFPVLKIDTYIGGIGKGVTSSLTFANASSSNIDLDSDAFATLRSWGVAAFAVYLDPHTRATYADYYGRVQARTALQNAYDSALASNQTAYDNGTANVSTQLQNLSTAISNSETVLEINQDAEQVILGNAISTNNILTNSANLASKVITDAQNSAAATTNMNLVGAQTTSGIMNVAVKGAGTMAAGISGDWGGALAGVIDIPTYAIGQTTAMNAQTANVGVAIATSQEIVTATINANNVRNTETNRLNNTNLTKHQNTATAVLTTSNTAQQAQADNSAATQRANLSRSKATADANAARARDTASSAITNAYRSQDLQAPMQAGTYSNGENAFTRPLAWFAEVFTQPLGAIEAAAHQFARYGYNLGQLWNVDRWQVMRFYTYWQASDVWVTPSGNGATQGAADAVRDILIAGTTVWSDPASIGAVDIWENHL